MVIAKIKTIFDQAIYAAFGIILVFLLVGIAIGLFRLFLGIGELWGQGGITGRYLQIISDVLTLFILIELSRSLVEYFHTQQFHLTLIIDAAFVFVLREIMIKLFKNEASPEELYALGVLLLVLGGVRIGLSMVPQHDGRTPPSGP